MRNTGSGLSYSARPRNTDLIVEYHADAVANWLFGSITDTNRMEQMDELMRRLIYTKFGLPQAGQNRARGQP